MFDVLNQIKIGWRALNGFGNDRELQTISVATDFSVKIRAGRLTEGSLEIVLFQFAINDWPSPRSLPHGKGFDLHRYDIDGEKYLGLSRGKEGAIELFEAMLANVIEHVLIGADSSHKVLFRKFLDRVRDWQAFMSRGRGGLSRQEELGLIGELYVLQNLLRTSLPSNDVIEWWKGPLHGTHDFKINDGALEVKTTTSDDGFIVEVFDIAQLDPSGVSNLFLFGLRLKSEDSGGHSLPELIAETRIMISNSTSGLALFNKCLDYAGYRDEHAGNYVSKFSVSEILGYEVTAEFPSLRRNALPAEVFGVKYTLDLESLSLPNVTSDDALKCLGVFINGAS